MQSLKLSLSLTAACLMASLVAVPDHARAADVYPSKAITLVVPTSAAGGTDILARVFAERLGKALGQPVIVDNRPGANGILGTGQVARAASDGYTLLFTYAAAFVANPSLYTKIPYNVTKDFAPIAQIVRGGNMLLVRSELPVKTLQEFVAYVKARPDKMSYCSWGNGSGGHLTMESLKKQTGLVMTHVPYKGNAPCVQDILGGQVDATFGDVSSSVGFVLAGKLRALAVSGPSRVPQFPDVPTMNEAGYPFTTYSWYGMFAPAGTPPAIVNKLNAEVNKLLRDPAVEKRLRELNLTDLPLNTPAQFDEVVRHDLVGWGRLVKDANIKMD